mgnify:CR=1 FL=1
MWGRLAGLMRHRNSRRQLGPTAAEVLETRALLAGNVQVTLSGGHAVVTGDSADNLIRIRPDGGQLIVEGLEGTTINGGAAVFPISNDGAKMSGRLWMFLGDGNDSAVVSQGITFERGFRLYGEGGNDRLSALGATFQRFAGFFGDDANDIISIQDCTINGELQVLAGTGDDLLSVTDTVVNGSAVAHMEAGKDRVSLNGVGGSGVLWVNLGIDDDSLAMQNTTRSGDTVLIGKRGQDAFMLKGNTLNGSLILRGGVQNDAVELRDPNTFNGNVVIDAGKSSRTDFGDVAGGDQVNQAANNTFNAGKAILRSEGTEIPAPIKTRFDGTNGTGGLIKDADAADTAASNLAGSVPLTAVASSAQSAAGSGGVLLSRVPQITITGKTLAGATVTVDANEDGVFDEASVVADAAGDYVLSVNVTRKDLYTSVTGNDELTGRRTLKVRSTLSNSARADKSVEVDYITGSLVQFTSAQGTFEIELFDQQAPGVTKNFLGYVNPQQGQTDGRYTNSFIHRSVDNFVIQGGGFTINNGVIKEVPLDASVTGEFSVNRPNIKGTISMAHAGDPNNLTSQWFINTVDNPSLDDFDGRRHTVFGRLAANSQTVVDAIAALNQNNLTTQTGSSAMGEVPLTEPFVEFSRPLTGTVTATANSTQVTGIGTKFTEELRGALFGLRSRIQINGQAFFVASVDSDTQLTLSQAPTFTASGVGAKSDFNDGAFAKFTSVKEILKAPSSNI